MNAFKQLLNYRGARSPVGTWILSASPLVAEAIAHAGFEWGVLDMEHTPLDMLDVVHLLQAVSATKMVPIVRVPSIDEVVVKRVLDTGACTLLFPFVQHAKDAQRAVAATRFPPDGVRGMSGVSRASKYGLLKNYPSTANRGIGVIVQLETPAALDHLEAIAQVPGVDAVFIGPADLSASMGYVGDFTHSAVMKLMAQAAQRCNALGMPIGTVGNTPEVVAQYRAAGFDFVAIGSDLGLLMRSAQAALAALHSGESEHVHTLSGGTQAMDQTEQLSLIKTQ